MPNNRMNQTPKAEPIFLQNNIVHGFWRWLCEALARGNHESRYNVLNGSSVMVALPADRNFGVL